MDFGGELFLGGSEESFFTSDFVYAKVSVKSNWRFTVNGIQFSNETLCKSDCQSIAEPGINTIIGPIEDITQIYANLDLPVPESGQLTEIKCNLTEYFPSKILY